MLAGEVEVTAHYLVPSLLQNSMRYRWEVCMQIGDYNVSWRGGGLHADNSLDCLVNRFRSVSTGEKLCFSWKPFLDKLFGEWKYISPWARGDRYYIGGVVNVWAHVTRPVPLMRWPPAGEEALVVVTREPRELFGS